MILINLIKNNIKKKNERKKEKKIHRHRFNILIHRSRLKISLQIITLTPVSSIFLMRLRLKLVAKGFWRTAFPFAEAEPTAIGFRFCSIFISKINSGEWIRNWWKIEELMTGYGMETWLAKLREGLQ